MSENGKEEQPKLIIGENVYNITLSYENYKSLILQYAYLRQKNESTEYFPWIPKSIDLSPLLKFAIPLMQSHEQVTRGFYMDLSLFEDLGEIKLMTQKNEDELFRGSTSISSFFEKPVGKFLTPLFSMTYYPGLTYIFLDKDAKELLKRSDTPISLILGNDTQSGLRTAQLLLKFGEVSNFKLLVYQTKGFEDEEMVLSLLGALDYSR